MTIAIIVNCQMALTIFLMLPVCPLHLPARSIVCVGVEIRELAKDGRGKCAILIGEQKD